jgi:hypothetical protein
MNALVLSVCIAALSLIGAIIVTFFAWKSAKKNALIKIKQTNSKLSNDTETAKRNKSLSLAK